MVRFSVFAICLVLALAFNFVVCSEFGSDTEVNFVENLSEFLYENPEIELQPLVEEVSYDGSSSRIQRTYTFGRRISGE